MKIIKKIKLTNFKRFESLTLNFDEKMNILIGDNEAGKSSILSAIDLVLSGNRNKVENIGLENLLNSSVVERFLASKKNYDELPSLSVELYLDEQNNDMLNGKNNSDGITCDGLQLICEPDNLLGPEIIEVLNQSERIFPYEYYTISFTTFSGNGYSSYSKFLTHILIDNSAISNEYATRDYVKTMYYTNSNDIEKNRYQNEYRRYKSKFKDEVLHDLNGRIKGYEFSVKSDVKSNLETDLTIEENHISIDNKGKGRQCFIKTEFALRKKAKGKELNVVLIEEPENHLSYTNMKGLISKIDTSEDKQIFIATHNDLICSRLDLRKAIILNHNSFDSLTLKILSADTAKFFIKSPSHNILEFILSKKVILVEGDSEYIMLESFFELVTHNTLESSGVSIISIGGTAFKRYLEIAKILNIKTAVIRDNDANFQENCIENYKEYQQNDNIRIFFETDNSRFTFEISLYQNNPGLYEKLFSENRKTLSVQEYMLNNKTEAAYQLLLHRDEKINIPEYIQKAIIWINE